MIKTGWILHLFGWIFPGGAFDLLAIQAKFDELDTLSDLAASVSRQFLPPK